MTQTLPLDLERLASFTGGDPQLERELISLYLATSALYLERMRAAGGGEGWAKAAHALKGASANIGATAMARLAEAAERAATPSPDRLEELEAVRDLVQRRARLTAPAARARQARAG
jgi:HPt (histidine-containing phosphotransfer) domain-containing protein